MRTQPPGGGRCRVARGPIRDSAEERSNPQNGEAYNTTNARFWQGVSGTLSAGLADF